MNRTIICFSGAIGLIGLLLFYILGLNHISIGEVGVAYDAWDGSLTVQTNAGWHVTSPLVRVVTLSTLPQSVHVPSDAKVINTKIVRLNPERTLEFVKIQGFAYSLHDGLPNILMGYAFSGKSFPFLDIVQEGGTENIATK